MKYFKVNFRSIDEDLLLDPEFGLYLEQFEFNVDMLNYRLQQFSKLDYTNADPNNHQYCLMVTDALLVCIRAMLLDKGNYQYSFINFFKKCGDDARVQMINDYLDQKIPIYGSVRESLKFVTDKYICHVDSVGVVGLATANTIMAQLKMPSMDVNMENIIDNLTSIINK